MARKPEGTVVGGDPGDESENADRQENCAHHQGGFLHVCLLAGHAVRICHSALFLNWKAPIFAGGPARKQPRPDNIVSMISIMWHAASMTCGILSGCARTARVV